MLKFLKNSQIRLLFSGTFFTVAFIWMAMTAYDVDKQEIQVFAVFSVLLLGLMVVAGLLLAIVLFLFKRGRNRDGLLGKIETIEQETANAAATKNETDNPPV